MGRLHRFEEHRFVGTRDTMRVYDCDDSSQFEDLELRISEEDLLGSLQLQAFAPDVVDEAINRGFRPLRRSSVRRASSPAEGDGLH